MNLSSLLMAQAYGLGMGAGNYMGQKQLENQLIKQRNMTNSLYGGEGARRDPSHTPGDGYSYGNPAAKQQVSAGQILANPMADPSHASGDGYSINPNAQKQVADQYGLMPTDYQTDMNSPYIQNALNAKAGWANATTDEDKAKFAQQGIDNRLAAQKAGFVLPSFLQDGGNVDYATALANIERIKGQAGANAKQPVQSPNNFYQNLALGNSQQGIQIAPTTAVPTAAQSVAGGIQPIAANANSQLMTAPSTKQQANNMNVYQNWMTGGSANPFADSGLADVGIGSPLDPNYKNNVAKYFLKEGYKPADVERWFARHEGELDERINSAKSADSMQKFQVAMNDGNIRDASYEVGKMIAINPTQAKALMEMFPVFKDMWVNELNRNNKLFDIDLGRKEAEWQKEFDKKGKEEQVELLKDKLGITDTEAKKMVYAGISPFQPMMPMGGVGRVGRSSGGGGSSSGGSGGGSSRRSSSPRNYSGNGSYKSDIELFIKLTNDKKKFLDDHPGMTYPLEQDRKEAYERIHHLNPAGVDFDDYNQAVRWATGYLDSMTDLYEDENRQTADEVREGVRGLVGNGEMGQKIIHDLEESGAIEAHSRSGSKLTLNPNDSHHIYSLVQDVLDEHRGESKQAIYDAIVAIGGYAPAVAEQYMADGTIASYSNESPESSSFWLF